MTRIALVCMLGLFMAACGRSGNETSKAERFPGFTPVGTAGELATLFADLHAVSRDQDGIVSFKLMRLVPGGYTMQDGQTDCRQTLQRLEGVQYTDDGTSTARVPADRITLDPQTPSGVVALIALVCNKAEEHRMIIGAFDDIKALELLYGPYHPEVQAALWRGMQVPPTLDQDGVFHNAQGVVRVLFSKEFAQAGATKRLLLTYTQPNEDAYTCHACAPLLNAAVFVRVGEKWRNEAFYPYLAFSGTSGHPPTIDWVQIGTDQFALLSQDSTLHQGIPFAYVSLEALGDTGLTPLLFVGQEGAPAEEAPTVAVTFDALPSLGYATAIVTMTRRPLGHAPHVAQWHYTFDGTQYVTRDRLPDMPPSPTVTAATPVVPTVPRLPDTAPADPRSAPASTARPDRVEAPAIQVGDSYTLETVNLADSKRNVIVTRDVVALEGPVVTVVVTNVTSGKKRTLSYDRHWGYRGSVGSDQHGITFMPPLQYFDFPLSVGQTWRAASIETDRQTGRQRQHVMVATVDGWERVRVPAGEFDAVKVTLKTAVSDGTTVFNGLDVSWYAPLARRSVLSELTGTARGSGREEKTIVRLLTYRLQ